MKDFQKIISFLIVTLLFVFSSFRSEALIFQYVASGNFNTLIWNQPGLYPTTGDTVVINTGTTVTIVGFNTDGSRNSSSAKYGFKLNKFTSTPASGGSLIIDGGSVSLGIETSFSGISTVINSRTYYLGQSFTNGVSTPEVKKYSGDIIYVDNRPSITRSINQREDIKVVLQF